MSSARPRRVPLLDLQQVTFDRPGGDAFALHVPRFRLWPGERLLVSGPSGSGKSTFLDLLALLRGPTSAAVFEVAGSDVAALWRRSARDARTRLRAAHMGYVLQTGGLLPYLNVEQNLLLPQRLLGRMDRPWLAQLLEALGLAALRRRLPSALSIGERQRVAVARAMAHRPALVLADEPTASLDAQHGSQVMKLLVSLCSDAGTGLVVVSHDTGLARQHGLEPVACVREPKRSLVAR